MVTAEELREATAKFATGVTIVATRKPDGLVQAMTANAFTSICVNPPLVLVSVGHARNTFPHVRKARRYTVNVLRREQIEVARYFVLADADRTDNAPVKYIDTRRGMPAIEGSLAFLDCQVVAAHAHGDHTIFVAEVLEAYTASSGEPLLFYDSSLRSLDGA